MKIAGRKCLEVRKRVESEKYLLLHDIKQFSEQFFRINGKN